MQEASILWQLRHPNIVGLSGVSIQADKGYLLMVSRLVIHVSTIVQGLGFSRLTLA